MWGILLTLGPGEGPAVAARTILGCIPGFLKNDWVHAFRLVRPAH